MSSSTSGQSPIADSKDSGHVAGKCVTRMDLSLVAIRSAMLVSMRFQWSAARVSAVSGQFTVGGVTVPACRISAWFGAFPLSIVTGLKNIAPGGTGGS
jgi:hypothetical protein